MAPGPVATERVQPPGTNPPGDLATATDTIHDIGPANAEDAPIILLPLSRQNGVGDGGEHVVALADPDKPESYSFEVKAPSLFGGLDGDVKASVWIQTRKDATEDWEDVAAFENIAKASDKIGAKSGKNKGQLRAVYTVEGSVGGHAVDLEVIAKPSKS